MNDRHNQRHRDTIVIGASQAGLSAGYHLAKHNADYLLLTQEGRTGDTWRSRWDSLRLFTPAKFSGLPGKAFPAAPRHYPSKDEVADYLAAYAEQYGIRIRHNTRVSTLRKDGDDFVVDTDDGPYSARNVVVATGTNPVPRVPACAEELGEDIRQIHSSAYKRPSSLPEGDVLVVGAGTSGTEIALELATKRSANVYLSGNPPPHTPDFIVNNFVNQLWWVAKHILTVRTPIGRKARMFARSKGAPLERISIDDVTAAGAECVPRVAGANNGQPQLEDGRTLDVRSVLWCTGYRPDYSWIEGAPLGDDGWPVTDRGATAVPGLYFLGTLFQYGLTSGLTGGVGRDAGWIADRIYRNRPS